MTSLRFFAAAAVVVHHYFNVELPLFAYRGLVLDRAVSFFFILSGFVLYYASEERTVRSAPSFIIARLARIWPAHLAALLLYVGVAIEPFPPWPVFWANFFLLQSWTTIPVIFFSLNIPSWSLSTELLFYVSFPWLARNFKQNWFWKLGAAAVIVYSLIRICDFYEIPPEARGSFTTMEGLLYAFPPARMLEFILGMTCGLFFRKPRAKKRFPIASFLEGLILLLAAVDFCLPRILGSYGLDALLFSPALGRYWDHSGMAVSFACLIYIFAREEGWFSQLLTRAPIVFLGRISFGIFLFHYSILIRPDLWKHGAGVLPIFLYAILVLAAATVSYYLIERPIARLVRGLPSRPKRLTVQG